jgi:hypothetical protein
MKLWCRLGFHDWLNVRHWWEGQTLCWLEKCSRCRASQIKKVRT